MKQVEGSLRERVRCSTLVDWPVYPRLRRTIPVALLAVKLDDLTKKRPNRAFAASSGSRR